MLANVLRGGSSTSVKYAEQVSFCKPDVHLFSNVYASVHMSILLQVLHEFLSYFDATA